MVKDKIKIAVIDSGINDSFFTEEHEIIHVANHSFSSSCDYLNHGTICTSIIVDKVKDCVIYNLKVFDRKLITSSKNILEAIDWCVGNDIDIINLSLSITDLNCYYEFRTICNKALENKCIIIAAADNLGQPCYPAYLNNTIGVGIANIDENSVMYSDSPPIHLYTNGSYKNSPHYTSFATAKVTGLVANILINNSKNKDIIWDVLKKHSITYDYNNIVCHNKPFDFKSNTERVFKEKKDNLVYLLQNIDLSFLGTYNEFNLIEEYKDLLEVTIKSSDYIKSDSGNDFLLNHPSLLKFSLPCDYKPLTSKILLGNVALEVIDEFSQKFPEKTLYTIYPTKVGSIREINSISQKTLFDIDNLTNIPNEHIFRNSIPTVALLNLSSFPNLLSIELEILRITKASHRKIKIISQSELSPLWGMDYLSNRILPLESSISYIKGFVEYYNELGNNGLVMSVPIPNLSNKKVKTSGFEQLFLYYTSSILAYQPDYIYLIIDEFTDMSSLSNLLMNLKSFANTQIQGIIVLELDTLSNMNFYLSDYERKHILQRINIDKKLKKMKESIKNHDILIKVFEYNEEKNKRDFFDNIKNLFEVSFHKE